MSTEAKIKHTPLDLDDFEQFVRCCLVNIEHRWPAMGEGLHGRIDLVVAEIRRNRRLLEAGERLAKAVKPFVTKVNGLPNVARTIDEAGEARAALAAYQEAAKS